jgi:hypothetical protein
MALLGKQQEKESKTELHTWTKLSTSFERK